MDTDKSIEILKELGAQTAAAVDPRSIRTEPAFLAACEQNRCGSYARSWTCPPAENGETFRRAAEQYSTGIVFQQCTRLMDSFDADGMQRAQDAFSDLCRAAAARFSGSIVFGTGPCQVCARCSYPAPCPRPEDQQHNLEAALVDVTALCELAGLSYIGPSPSVTYTGLLLLGASECVQGA